MSFAFWKHFLKYHLSSNYDSSSDGTAAMTKSNHCPPSAWKSPHKSPHKCPVAVGVFQLSMSWLLSPKWYEATCLLRTHPCEFIVIVNCLGAMAPACCPPVLQCRAKAYICLLTQGHKLSRLPFSVAEDKLLFQLRKECGLEWLEFNASSVRPQCIWDAFPPLERQLDLQAEFDLICTHDEEQTWTKWHSSYY